MVATVKYQQNFNIYDSNLTLKDSLQRINADEQSDIPFLVWLLENPESLFPLPGKINLYNHDCWHILLDRGRSLFDEAFVVGFTMGSERATNQFHLAVFKFLSNLLYPQPYKFEGEHFKLFDLGFNYGRKLKVKNLNQVDFKAYENQTVGELRKLFGIDLAEVKQYCDLS